MPKRNLFYAQSGGVTAVLNAGAQENKGFELETMWNVNEFMRLTGNVGYLDAEIT